MEQASYLQVCECNICQAYDFKTCSDEPPKEMSDTERRRLIWEQKNRREKWGKDFE